MYLMIILRKNFVLTEIYGQLKRHQSFPYLVQYVCPWNTICPIKYYLTLNRHRVSEISMCPRCMIRNQKKVTNRQAGTRTIWQRRRLGTVLNSDLSRYLRPSQKKKNVSVTISEFPFGMRGTTWNSLLLLGPAIKFPYPRG